MDKTLQILNILGFAGVILMNYLSVALPLNGKTPGEISALYPTLFTPAGFTFSIWSVIYLLLLVFTIKQAKNLFRSGLAAPAFVRTIGPWFFLNCISNAAWLVAWHHEQIALAFVIMLVILATLVQIYLRLGIGRSDVSTGILFGVHLPFSVYLGWITVATIANASVLLTNLGWEGWGLAPGTWAAVMVVAGSLIGIAVLLIRRDVAYGLVLAWAFFGIWSARKNDASEAAGLVAAVTMASLVAVLAVSVFVLATRLRNNPSAV